MFRKSRKKKIEKYATKEVDLTILDFDEEEKVLQNGFKKIYIGVLLLILVLVFLILVGLG